MLSLYKNSIEYAKDHVKKNYIKSDVNKFLKTLTTEDNPYIYKLVYEDILFFYKLLNIGNKNVSEKEKFSANSLLAAKCKLFQQISYNGETFFNAGCNFLDVFIISNKIHILLDFIGVDIINFILDKTDLCKFILETYTGEENPTKSEIIKMIQSILENLTLENCNNVCKTLFSWTTRGENLTEFLNKLVSLIEKKDFFVNDGELMPIEYKGLFDLNGKFNPKYLEIYNSPLMTHRFKVKELRNFFTTLVTSCDPKEINRKMDGLVGGIINLFLELNVTLNELTNGNDGPGMETKSEPLHTSKTEAMPPETFSETYIEASPETFDNRLSFSEPFDKQASETLSKDPIIFQITEFYDKLIEINKNKCDSYCDKRKGMWLKTQKQCIQNNCYDNPFIYFNSLKKLIFGEGHNFKNLKHLVESETYNEIAHIAPHKYIFLNKLYEYNIAKLKVILELFQGLFSEFYKINGEEYVGIVKIVKLLKQSTKPKYKLDIWAVKKHGGNHIKRTHKKNHGRRKSIRNIRHNRHRTRKT
jgi:hypothetical protein